MNEQSPKPSTTTVVLRVLTSTVIAIIATYIILVAILLISVRNDLALPGERFLSQIAPGEVEEEVEEEVDVFDLDSWSTEELVAQILFVMTPSDDTVGFYILARQGIGSIVLSGGNPADDMAEELEYAQHQAPRGIRMLVSSDEEGGEVAYLSKLISGPLPSPPEIATWSSDQIRDATRAYGEKLANLGSHLVLAPALDLTVPGAHMAELDRTFSGDPTKVSEVGIAWMNGMHDAGMSVVLKHWPGIGSAPDTHNTATTIAPLETLEQADLLPFDILIDEGAEMVMV
ncbi:MAG: hypothetical protein FWE87_05560, partial [Coriobacteriia bacterium]|nr:hypothetical protein [Coriobacteriia bacterium]